jgi:NTP pyrophosphatase (non-canonical NTP hydrolase)
MNINDFKLSNIHIGPGDQLDQIFTQQLELMVKYHDIEKANGLIVTEDVPVNLHDARGQFRLKDFAWRITEELGESLEAFRIHPDKPEHYQEELADALHFLTEFTILSGMSLEEYLSPPLGMNKDKFEYLFAGGLIHSEVTYDSLLKHTGRVVEVLAITCNCLKNKPWKSTQMMTDEDYFYSNLRKIWDQYAWLCMSAGLSSDEVFDLYFRKSEVNKFRQRSNY